MQFSRILSFAALMLTIQCTPITPAAPQCTVNHFEKPHFKRDCTFQQHTVTETRYEVECGGCELVTQKLGVGLPCATVTTMPGTATQVKYACATPNVPVVTPPSSIDVAVGNVDAGEPSTYVTSFVTTYTSDNGSGWYWTYTQTLQSTVTEGY